MRVTIPAAGAVNSVGLDLWLTNYRRNRVNFASFALFAYLILRGQSGVDLGGSFGHEDFYTTRFVISDFYTITVFYPF